MTNNPFSKKQLRYSLIMPCYGLTWRFLSDSIRAIAESDYPHCEIIVVFDGKNRAGERKIKQLSDQFSQLSIKWFTIEHGGAPKARNYGADKASGDLLAFIDPDIYLYPESLRMWANVFEQHPHINRVWGVYDVKTEGGAVTVGGSMPLRSDGKPLYWAFRSSNYCSGAFPIRRSAFVRWDEALPSLQDWDMAIRMLKTSQFEGTDWWYITTKVEGQYKPRSFFLTEPPSEGGISHDSSTHWLERVQYIKKKNDIPLASICVTSLGAPAHGVHIAKMLDADYLPVPWYKPHTYKMIYVIGFYTGSAQGASNHMAMFGAPQEVRQLSDGFLETVKYGDFKKVIHWIGTDVLNMHWNNSYQKLKALRQWMNEQKVINLTEFENTHDELEEVGVTSTIVPIPPHHFFNPIPLPELFTVGIYENEFNKMYNESLMQEIVRAMPDVFFYFFGDESKKGLKTENSEHLGVIDMKHWMPKFSCYLRITVHDGLPLTAVEFLMAGRQVVTNVKIRGSYQVKAERKDIIEILRKVRHQSADPQWSTYWNQKLNINHYKKTIYDLL